MKKILAFVLMTALLVSLAVPAFAASPSAEATPEDLTPEVVESTDVGLVVTPATDVEGLPEASQEEFTTAVEALPNVVTENQRVENVAYVTLSEGTDRASITVQPKNLFEPVVMQYVDGEWVEKNTTINADGTIVVEDVENGTVAFVVELVPVTLSDACKAVPEEALSKELQTEIAQAREDLFKIVPTGMLIRNYFYAETDGSDAGSSFTFQTKAFQNLVVKQFVDGQWIELEYTVSEDGTITVEGVVDGPMAILVN